MSHRNEGLIMFQIKNCTGCKFADVTRVGSGLPCCTKPLSIETNAGMCMSRREQEAASVGS
jgi:hypothetical protein